MRQTFNMLAIILTRCAALPSASSLPWRSAIVSTTGSSRQALQGVVEQLGWPSMAQGPDIALLSMSPAHAQDLEVLSAEAARAIGARLLIGVVGAGVIGDGKELDLLSPLKLDRPDQEGMSLIAGRLPPRTCATPFVVNNEELNGFPNWAAILGDGMRTEDGGADDDDHAPAPPTRPGFLLFADQSSAASQISALLNDLSPGACVVGGLTCPPSPLAPSIALYESGDATNDAEAGGSSCRLLPAGSLVGVHLSGPHFEIHSLTAQGAAPVGPSYLVTAGGGGMSRNLVASLDGRPAMEVLQELAEQEDPRVVRLLLGQKSLFVGISVAAPEATAKNGAGDASDHDESISAAPAPVGAGDGFVREEEEEEELDYLLRQVLGVNGRGGLYIGLEPGVRIDPGQTRLQFHVRDEEAASEELALWLDRYRLERNVADRFGDRAPLAALQFACQYRGRNLFTQPDQDSRLVRAALGEALPTGGFFCSAEVGPLGIKGFGAPEEQEAQPFIHGFSTCLALFYASADSEDVDEGEARLQLDSGEDR